MNINLDVSPAEYDVLLEALTDYGAKSLEFLPPNNLIVGHCLSLMTKVKEARKEQK